MPEPRITITPSPLVMPSSNGNSVAGIMKSLTPPLQQSPVVQVGQQQPAGAA